MTLSDERDAEDTLFEPVGTIASGEVAQLGNQCDVESAMTPSKESGPPGVPAVRGGLAGCGQRFEFPNLGAPESRDRPRLGLMGEIRSCIEPRW